jgi:hypothetical protein
MKYVIINQPAGLGDIFYLQKISKLLLKNNFNIIWPVISQFSYIKDYIKETNIAFVSEKEDFKYKNIYLKNYNELIQETHGDDTILSIPFVHVLMKQKYPMLNLTGEDWADYFKFERNTEREKQLKEKYKIADGEDFIFVNDIFASPPNMIKRDINISTNKKIIYNDGEPCHIFDYCWLFENASELHLVESAFCYLVEILSTKGDLYMYSRVINGKQQHPNFDYVNHIYKKNWNKIQ